MRNPILIATLSVIVALLMSTGAIHAQIPTPVPTISANALLAYQAWSKDQMEKILCMPVMVYISEAMINVSQNVDYWEDSGEYIELYNWGSVPVNISQWKISDYQGWYGDSIVDMTNDGGYGIPGTTIPAGGYALIVDPDTDVEALYGTLIEQHADQDKLIIVTVDDDAIGDGLLNDGGSITITTNRNVYHGNGAKQKRTLLNYGQQYDGKSMQWCGNMWKKTLLPTPGYSCN